MKPNLLFRNKDFVMDEPCPPHFSLLEKDLEMEVIFSAMSGGDDYLYQIIKNALSRLLTDIQEIEYRQDILRDCLYNPELVRLLYDMVSECLRMEKEKLSYGVFGHYPSAVLHQSISFVHFILDYIRKIREFMTKNILHFESAGIKKLFSMFINELNESYLTEIEHHLHLMEFKKGVLISAKIGQGNKSYDYVLRKPNKSDKNWLQRLFSRKEEQYIIKIAPRDENGFRALSDLEDEGLKLIADAMSHSTSHILGFFKSLKTELGFYVACINLSERLTEKKVPLCFPVPLPKRERYLKLDSLYDPCLALTSLNPVTANSLRADNCNTYIITGANQGGKSTFLRSLGLAQLMMQTGLFVTANEVVY